MGISKCGFLMAMMAMVGLWGVPAQADQRRLVLSLGAGEKYNDNIFFTGDDEIDDYVTTLSGELEVINRTERLDLSFLGRAVNQDYADNDELDGLDQYYKGRIGYWLASHLKATLDGSFTRDTQPDRDVEVTGLVLGTATRDTQQYGLGIQYDLSDITSAYLSYKYQYRDYDSTLYSDYNSHQGDLGLTHRLDKYLGNTTGRLNLKYAHYDYHATQLDYYAVTVGFLHRLSELWHLRVDIGARYTESEFRFAGSMLTNNSWGGVGEMEFGYQGKSGDAGLTLAHDVGTASGLDGSVERSSAVLDLSYRFTENFRTGISGGYYLNTADSGDLALDDTDKNTGNLRSYLRASLTGTLFLDVSYTYSQIEDNLDDTTRERSLYLLRVAWESPMVE